MIRKSGHIIVVLLLLISTSGVEVTGHYCGNSLQGIAFFHHPKPCCENKGCCHNETSFHQLKEDFFGTDNSQQTVLTAFDFTNPFCYMLGETGFISSYGCLLPFAEAPPGRHQTLISFIHSYRC